jgi:hypothetical protein
MATTAREDGMTGRRGTSAATPVSGLPAPTRGEHADLLLHRWRRLDWRFLIPTTGWARIGCGGDADDELRRALPLLDAEVRDLSVASSSALPETCDVIVLVHPTRAELRSAVPALRPGGWLYAEVRRAPTAAHLRSLRGWANAFRREGLEQVSVQWHAPDVGSAEQIIRLDATAAVRHALLRSGGSRPGLRNIAARVALTTGLLPLALSSGSVLGHRPLDAAT